MLVAIYSRVATEEQVKEGYSLSTQREKLKEFCKSKEMKDHRFYFCEGVTIKDAKRPSFHNDRG